MFSQLRGWEIPAILIIVLLFMPTGIFKGK